MNPTRLLLLPDPSFAPLRNSLEDRLSAVGKAVTPENFGSLLDEKFTTVLKETFAQAGADEGTLWLRNAERSHLVPVMNSGPNAEAIVGTFRQPLSEGLISMVLASEQPFIENEVYKNEDQSKLLDTTLRLRTYAMIAIPFYLLGDCRGVLSCVQLLSEGTSPKEPAGFTPDSLDHVRHGGAVLAQLLEYRVLRILLGLSGT
jgi:hypothetical protein